MAIIPEASLELATLNGTALDGSSLQEAFIAQQPAQLVLRLARRVLNKVTSGGENNG